ncbi:IS3 family transposase, partial [Aliarcobacter butzleri]
IERFWRSAKVEKIYLNEYDRVSVLKNDVKDYINFYNYKRFHESLQYKKPIEVYFNSMKINEQNYNSKKISVA